MPHVGYWTAPGDAVALRAPIVVASMHHADALDDALGDRYVSEFFGLRPEVLLSLYVERSLWDRFMVGMAADRSAAPCREQSVAGRCSHVLSVTLWPAANGR
jgi:hypothetical protein